MGESDQGERGLKKLMLFLPHLVAEQVGSLHCALRLKGGQDCSFLWVSTFESLSDANFRQKITVPRVQRHLGQ